MLKLYSLVSSIVLQLLKEYFVLWMGSLHKIPFNIKLYLWGHDLAVTSAFKALLLRAYFMDLEYSTYVYALLPWTFTYFLEGGLSFCRIATFFNLSYELNPIIVFSFYIFTWRYFRKLSFYLLLLYSWDPEKRYSHFLAVSCIYRI